MRAGMQIGQSVFDRKLGEGEMAEAWLTRGAMKTLFRLFVLCMPVAGCVWPDIPPPPSKGERVKMKIGQDSAAFGGPVLEIPARLFRQHAGVFDDADRIRMLAAGVLLSAAIFFAGRWFWKRRERQALGAGTTPSKAGPAIHAVLACAAILGAGALIRTATAGPNDRYDPGNLGLASANGTLEGTVAVQISRDGDTVILHLTPPRRRPGPRPPEPRP
jgi:hypothetical protein